MWDAIFWSSSDSSFSADVKRRDHRFCSGDDESPLDLIAVENDKYRISIIKEQPATIFTAFDFSFEPQLQNSFNSLVLSMGYDEYVDQNKRNDDVM